MTDLAYNLRNALSFLTEAPQRALAKVSTRFGNELPQVAPSVPPPPHVTSRLEVMFDALGELAAAPNEARALSIACNALQRELPTGTLAAGLYDIDADAMRFVIARGDAGEALQHASLSFERCFSGHPADAAFITRGNALHWIGSGDSEPNVLVCPIVRDGALLGVLALADPELAPRFDRHDLELVSYAAEQLASVVHAQRRRRAEAAARARR